ncbi:hypothetical protein BDY21DRAFT_385093 [Lineolata rhizophorae]|uniref:TPR domain-containing protein n=1 Tax=Lineolata rhizophorae TaxID=578093 RepID=A0A6A6P3M5_9PEZI|nr:hypothetical protein BDY21DRAFT_385093 [Lineolata rhizophorae]
MFPLALCVVFVGLGGLVWVNYFVATYYIGEFAAFPEPVANKLRRALYFTDARLAPKEAIKYYREAFEVAQALGMDPLSPEVVGMKIKVAAFYEKIENIPRAIAVMESLKAESLQWLEDHEDWKEELKRQQEQKKQREEQHDEEQSEPETPEVNPASRRNFLLKRLIQVGAKLGEYYSSRYIEKRDKAEENLVFAVETYLKEKQRREKEGVLEGEEDWINDEESGAALEVLAHHYEERDRHYLATPLFLQALAHSPKDSCHSVVLMNNLSISLAQQSPPPGAISASPYWSSPSRETLISQARQWANKSIALAGEIPRTNRSDECDVGCAVALHNLGEFAEMEDRLDEAKRNYEEAQTFAKKIGFGDGIKNSKDGLQRVKQKATKKPAQRSE